MKVSDSCTVTRQTRCWSIEIQGTRAVALARFMYLRSVVGMKRKLRIVLPYLKGD